MKVTRREALLLGVLGAMIVVFIFYQFVYTPQVNTFNELVIQKNLLSKQKEIIMNNISKKQELEEEYKSLNFKINDDTQVYFDNIIQEELILIINEFINISNVQMESMEFTSITLDDIQKTDRTADMPLPYLHELGMSIRTNTPLVKNEQEEKKNEQEENNQNEIFNISSVIVLKGSYNEVISFINSVESYERNIYIKELSLEVQEDNRIKADLTLDFYSIPKLFPTDEIITNWDNTLASNGFTNNYSNLSNPVEDKPDLFMTLKPYTADLPTVVIGLADDSTRKSYIYSDNKGFENGEIIITNKGDKYYVKYKTSTDKYPNNYLIPIEFTPNNKYIKLKVYSSIRGTNKDKSGVNLKIHNNTNLQLKIQINNDDKDNSRLNITDKRGNISIDKGVVD